jgi:hypothetical protein
MNLDADPYPDPNPIFGILSILDPGWKKSDINLNFPIKVYFFLTCSLLGIVMDPDRHAIDANPDPEK